MCCVSCVAFPSWTRQGVEVFVLPPSLSPLKQNTVSPVSACPVFSVSCRRAGSSADISALSQLIRDHTSPPARLVLKSIRKAAEGGRQGYQSPKEIVHTLSRAEALAPVGSCKSSDVYTIGQQNKRLAHFQSQTPNGRGGGE